MILPGSKDTLPHFEHLQSKGKENGISGEESKEELKKEANQGTKSSTTLSLGVRAGEESLKEFTPGLSVSQSFVWGKVPGINPPQKKKPQHIQLVISQPQVEDPNEQKYEKTRLHQSNTIPTQRINVSQNRSQPKALSQSQPLSSQGKQKLKSSQYYEKNPSRRGWFFRLKGENENEKRSAILSQQTTDKKPLKNFCRWIFFDSEEEEYRVGFRDQKSLQWLMKQPFIDKTSIKSAEDVFKTLDQVTTAHPDYQLLYPSASVINESQQSKSSTIKHGEKKQEEDKDQSQQSKSQNPLIEVPAKEKEVEEEEKEKAEKEKEKEMEIEKEKEKEKEMEIEMEIEKKPDNQFENGLELSLSQYEGSLNDLVSAKDDRLVPKNKKAQQKSRKESNVNTDEKDKEGADNDEFKYDDNHDLKIRPKEKQHEEEEEQLVQEANIGQVGREEDDVAVGLQEMKVEDEFQEEKARAKEFEEEETNQENEVRMLALLTKDLANGSKLYELLDNVTIAYKAGNSYPAIIFAKYYWVLQQKQTSILGKRSNDHWRKFSSFEILSKKCKNDNEQQKKKKNKQSQSELSDDDDDDDEVGLFREESEEYEQEEKKKDKDKKAGKSSKKRDPESAERTREMNELCGYSRWMSPRSFQEWQETEIWKKEFQELCDSLHKEGQAVLKGLIENCYDPVFYLFAMRKGFYDWKRVKASLRKNKKSLLGDLYNTCHVYYEKYAKKYYHSEPAPHAPQINK